MDIVIALWMSLYLKTNRNAAPVDCSWHLNACWGWFKGKIILQHEIKLSRHQPTTNGCLHCPFNQKHCVLHVCLSGFVSYLFDCSALHAIQTLAASLLITTCYQPANKTDKADSMSAELAAPPPTPPPPPPVSLSKHEPHTHTCTQPLSEAGEHRKRSDTTSGGGTATEQIGLRDRLLWQWNSVSETHVTFLFVSYLSRSAEALHPRSLCLRHGRVIAPPPICVFR